MIMSQCQMVPSSCHSLAIPLCPYEIILQMWKISLLCHHLEQSRQFGLMVVSQSYMHHGYCLQILYPLRILPIYAVTKAVWL